MKNTVLETDRLRLRPWREEDAESLYEYARDERVGPIAGWPAHTSAENSREIIREILSVEENYAVTVRPGDAAVGSIGLMIGQVSNLAIPEDEAEIGYWIGVPFWGRGYIPEATRELIRHAFEDLGMTTLWCGWFDGNEKSRRVGEKCGFRHVRTEDKYWPLIDKTVTQHISRLTRQEWEFEKNNRELLRLIDEWTEKLLSLDEETISVWRNAQGRTVRQIVGHMVDSASNNTHRIVHLQYQPSPLIFPDYAGGGNNDRWIAIQDYATEDWHDLVMLWKYANRHIAHVIGHVDPGKLAGEWIAASGKHISLHAMIIDYLRHFKLHITEIEELIK